MKGRKTASILHGDNFDMIDWQRNVGGGGGLPTRPCHKNTRSYGMIIKTDGVMILYLHM